MMNMALVLLILRLISAALLLIFLGTILWLMLKDLQIVTTQPTRGPQTTATLEVLESGSPSVTVGEIFKLVPLTSLGRSSTNTISLNDDFASSEHALLSFVGTQWWLEDLKSSNGTQLNGLLVGGATVIMDSDQITIGRTKLLFRI